VNGRHPDRVISDGHLRRRLFVAPDFLDHAPLPGQAPGLDGARRKWAMYLNAAPDLRVTIEDLVAEDDKVGGAP
jgi:predicted ester cyclase